AAAVEQHERAGDGEAEPETSVPPAQRAVGLPEAVEDVRQERARDTFAVVAHADPDAALDAIEIDLDPAAARRELDRVGQQVAEHLLQPIGAAAHEAARLADPQLDVDVALCRSEVGVVDGELDDLIEPHDIVLEHELAGDDARDIEQVAHDLALQPR